MKYLLLIPFLLAAHMALACSCAPSPTNFCESIRQDEHVALVKVVAHYGEFMDVQIVDEIRHQFGASTVTVIGQDGLNCSEWLEQFAIGDTLILGLQDWGMTDTFNLSFCGLYHLSYENGEVTGAITSTSNSQPYADLTDNFAACATLASVAAPEEIQLQIHYADGTLHIESPIAEIHAVELIDMLGQRVLMSVVPNGRSASISLYGWKPALYLLEVKTDRGTTVRKVLIP